MPYSAAEGKEWTRQRVVAHAPGVVLDVGVGAGAYATLLRPHLPHARFVGIEAWEPYVAEFVLHELYDELHLADVRDLDALPGADVVVFGDVLEHMAEHDAVAVWNLAREAASAAVYLSVPIVHCPQDDWGGNPFERHVVDDWTHDRVMAAFGGITDYQVGELLGVYEAGGSP